MILGSIGPAIYVFKIWSLAFKNQNNVKDKAIITFLSILILPLLSYFAFGQWVHIAWSYINKQTADKHVAEIIYCDIRSFNSGRHRAVNFKYQSRLESFHVSYSTIKKFKNKSPENYQLEIKARKGIWNYYVVEEWDIVSKNQ